VTLEPWLDYPDFQALISAADAYLHPARFDAWGTTYVALAQGVPVIGSVKAGAAYDLLQHGVNGWRYNPEDTATLAQLMTKVHHLSTAQKQTMTKAALQSMEPWQPAQGAQTLLDNLPEMTR
jgi:glycosyltransferase involved in cell wall biosynthesis